MNWRTNFFFLTSMTQNWNLGRILDLRNQFIASSWDHKINHIIELENMTEFSINYHLKVNLEFSCNFLLTLSRSGISSLEVTSPISFPPTLSGMASVIIYKFSWKIQQMISFFFWANKWFHWLRKKYEISIFSIFCKKNWIKQTLCKTAFDLLASFPPFKRSPFPLRMANEAIYSNHAKEK